MDRVNEDFVKRLCERLRLYFGEVSVRIDLNTTFGCTSIEVSLSNKEPIMINSALVSAQQRKRYYWTNIRTTQPNDRKFF